MFSTFAKTTFHIFLSVVIFVIFPICAAYCLSIISLKLMAAYFLVDLIILLFILKKHSLRQNRFAFNMQELEEKINVMQDSNRKEEKNNFALQAKIIRYQSLRKIVEELNEKLDLDAVAGHLVSIAFSLIACNKGNCHLYLIDRENHRLYLFKAKKEQDSLVVKAKQGDIFDLWVLRHSSPLLIEDSKKDFRFDPEKLKHEDLRPIGSLISAPFITESRFLGILRLDHPEALFYSQEDLRFLLKICDLGAVALENSELFQKTQELAIHDALTSLYTKGYFLERLREECKRGLRQKHEFCLLMLDIDFFKNYNDKFGHSAGDIVLKHISSIIREFLKDLNCIVCRFGGEEFCVIINSVDKDRAFQIADSLRDKIASSALTLRRQETKITVSIGIAGFPYHAVEEGELLQKADMAMYEAKRSGRNRTVIAK